MENQNQLKRKAEGEPDPEFFDDSEIKRRRLNFVGFKRKRVPTNTLIGIGDDDSTILAMAVPTKKNKYVRFDISEQGEAIKVGTVTEQAFTSEFPNVFRMNKSATLATDGTIEPDRLSKDVSIVKQAKEQSEEKEQSDVFEAPEEKSEPKPKSDEDKPKSDKDLLSLADEAGELSNTLETARVDKEKEEKELEQARAEDKQLNISEEIQEDIKNMVHEEHPSKDPMDTEIIPPANKYSSSEITRSYMDILQSRMKDSAPDKVKEQFEELQKLSLLLKGESKPVVKETKNDMPKAVEHIEEMDDENMEMEEEVIKKITVEDVKDVEMSNKSSDAMLSKGEAVNTRITDISTGHHLQMELVEQLDSEHTEVGKGTTVKAKDRKDVPTVVDMDTEMGDPNTDNKITLGADADTDRLGLPSSHSSTNTTSSNKIEATIGPMEGIERSQETIGLINRDKQLHGEVKATAKGMKQRVQSRLQREEFFSKRAEKVVIEQAQKQKTILELMHSGGDIKGFDEMMQNLVGQGVIPDADDVKMRKRVLAVLRKDNKIMNIQTAAAPTAEDVLAASVKEQAGTLGSGQRGGTGIGTPIFLPDTSRNDLYEMQRGGATLTETEAIEIREELTPLWNLFKLGRMGAGVKEMERMPTRLIKSDLSTVKAASRLRADMNQEEESFGYFMYWLLHDKLDPSRHATWRAFLTYATALGYNDLTQSQINWMITGNINGDLTSNTNFSTVTSEEGDPLDVLLDIRGKKLTRGTIESLNAQIVGNPEPQAQYPSRNTSPSAAPVDNSIHPDGTTSKTRQNRQTFQGVPSVIMNIPDPRFSRRGGIDVPNVRLNTIRNPKYDPIIQTHLKPGDEGHQPEFITEEIPDIGAGSKDISSHIKKAQSDRLLRSIPTKLYAPIHPQACDRYLGTTNYQRLSLPIDRYMKSYSQHPWGPEDFQQMYNWNAYTLSLYGGMLYAFVTDISMQRTSPVFDMNTPEAVGDEYMELNELIDELAKFQQNADDRADRVTDSGAAQRPLEEQLDKFHQDQGVLDKEKLFQGDVAIISTEGLSPFPTGSSGGTGVNPNDILPPGAIPLPPGPVIPGVTPGVNPWGPGDDPRYDKDKPWAPNNDARPDPTKPIGPDNSDFFPGGTPTNDGENMFSMFTSLLKTPTQIGVKTMDRGVTNKTSSLSNIRQTKDVELERKNKMFNLFFRR